MKIICTLVLAVVSLNLAASDLDVVAKVKDLQSDDPKARAAAVRDLTPVFVDMLLGLQKAGQDADPDVKKAFEICDTYMRAKLAEAGNAPLGGGRSRMGANETCAVAMCKSFCTAQDIYRRTDYNRDGVLEYAQALKGDWSLYENKAGDGDVAMIDRSFAEASGEPGKATPKCGYYVKILKKQGASASGGKRDYVMNGHMCLGYAMLAYPAQHGKTGNNCFLVSNAGTIFQKDLGPDTLKIAAAMEEFNPDNTWVISE